MKNVIAILLKMQSLATDINNHEVIRLKMIEDAQKLGDSPAEIGEMVANANYVIGSMVKDYKALSKEHFELIRAFEVRDMKPIDFSNLDAHKTAPYFSISAHNNFIHNDLKQAS